MNKTWQEYGFTTPISVLKITGERCGRAFIDYSVVDAKDKVLAVCKDEIIAEWIAGALTQKLLKLFE